MPEPFRESWVPKLSCSWSLIPLGPLLHVVAPLVCRVQRLCRCKSIQLTQMWPRFEYQHKCHTCVCLLLVLILALWEFSPGISVSSFFLQIPISPWMHKHSQTSSWEIVGGLIMGRSTLNINFIFCIFMRLSIQLQWVSSVDSPKILLI